MLIKCEVIKKEPNENSKYEKDNSWRKEQNK